MATTGLKIGKAFSRLAQAIKDKNTELFAVFTKYGVSADSKNLGQTLKNVISKIKSTPEFAKELAAVVVSHERSKGKTIQGGIDNKIESLRAGIKTISRSKSNFIGSNADGDIVPTTVADPEVEVLVKEFRDDAAVINDSDISNIEKETAKSNVFKNIVIAVVIAVVLFVIYKYVINK